MLLRLQDEQSWSPGSRKAQGKLWERVVERGACCCDDLCDARFAARIAYFWCEQRVHSSMVRGGRELSGTVRGLGVD